MKKGKLIITGDFNVHMDTPRNQNTSKFLDLLDSFGLSHHVEQVTHKSGHTLDLVISKSHDVPLDALTVAEPLISDHNPVTFNLDTNKPAFPRKEITYRKMRNFDLEDFQNDLTTSLAEFNPMHNSVSEAVDKYNHSLESCLDRHAPLTTRTITVRPQPPWYNDDIHDARKQKRKAEKKWRQTKLTVHKEIYKEKKDLCCAYDKESKTGIL